MYSYIKKLQSKQEHVRKQILVGSMIVCMSFVIVVWGYSLNDSYTTRQVATTDNSVKPFTLFSNSVTNAFTNISASVGSISFSKKEQVAPQPKQIDLIVVQPSQAH